MISWKTTTMSRTFGTTGPKTDPAPEGILSRLRKEKGLSLREAAAAIGISHTYLSALEKGQDPRTGNTIIPSRKVLVSACKLYGVSYGEMFSSFPREDKQDVYEDMARELNLLRRTDPPHFKRVLEIIYRDE